MIRLQFVAEDDFASRAIGWFSSGIYSHVDAVLADGSLLGARNDKIGKIPAGVQIRPPFYKPFARRCVFKLRTTNNETIKWMNFLFAQVGKPYDKKAILGFITGRDWRETDSWICSELQAAALEAAGIAPQLFLATSKITPVAAALVMSALGAET